MKAIGKNVEYEVEGGVLTLRIDLAQNLGRSASGKSVNVATTGGNVQLDGTDGAILGLNLYRKAG